MTWSAHPVELPRPVEVVGLPIRPLRTEELIDALVARAAAGIRTMACYANAHTVNLACGDERFRDVIAGSDLLYADGASVVWASRWSETRLPERMTSADYFPRFARRCAERGLSIYLLGGRAGVAAKAARRLCGPIPNLKIAGAHHGHFPEADSARIVEAINASQADVLAVGLSSPRQEFWLSEHGDELKAPVRWCVGALFDYLAGVERRAPSLMCRMNGEWLFRLLNDPIGKWRRYLVGNPLFVWNAFCRRPRRRPGAAPGRVVPATKG